MEETKTVLLDWLFTAFYVAKAKAESASDVDTRRFHEGEMNAYQNLKYALDNGEVKITE